MFMFVQIPEHDGGSATINVNHIIDINHAIEKDDDECFEVSLRNGTEYTFCKKSGEALLRALAQITMVAE